MPPLRQEISSLAWTKHAGFHLVVAAAVSLFCLFVLQAFPTTASSNLPTLSARGSIEAPGGSCKFQYLLVDDGGRRLLATDKAKASLTILDLNTNFVQSIPTGACRGVAIDRAMHQIYVGDVDGKLICLSYDIFKVQKEIKTPGPIDAITVDTKRHLIYADNDGGKYVWVINPKSGKIISTIDIGGIPAVVLYDPATDKIYLNDKTQSFVLVIDPNTFKISAKWSTHRASKLRGLAIDTRGHLLFAAGHTGNLSIIEMNTGQLVRSINIADGVDQIAYDQETERVFCACSTGTICVFDNKNLDEVAENVVAPPGTHTIALDPKTHDVWISYVENGRSYFRRYAQAP